MTFEPRICISNFSPFNYIVTDISYSKYISKYSEDYIHRSWSLL